MKIDVRFFAQARDLVGSEFAKVELPDECNVAQLRTELRERFPVLEPIANSLLITIDNEYAENTRNIEESQEITCFPPVSGG